MSVTIAAINVHTKKQGLGMSKQSDFVRENSKLLDSSKCARLGDLRFGSNERFHHALAKFLLAWEFKQSGMVFSTEAVFDGGKGRCDVFNLSDGVAYEVLDSELEENIKVKEGKYPVLVKSFKAKEVIKLWLKRISE